MTTPRSPTIMALGSSTPAGSPGTASVTGVRPWLSGSTLPPTTSWLAKVVAIYSSWDGSPESSCDAPVVAGASSPVVTTFLLSDSGDVSPGSSQAPKGRLPGPRFPKGLQPLLNALDPVTDISTYPQAGGT